MKNDNKEKVRFKLALSVIWMAVALTLIIYTAGRFYWRSNSVEIIVLSIGLLASALARTIIYGMKLTEINREARARQAAKYMQLSDNYEGQGNDAQVDVVECPECGAPIDVTKDPTLVCPNCGKRYKNPMHN